MVPRSSLSLLQGWVAKFWAWSVAAASRAAQQVKADRRIEVSFGCGCRRRYASSKIVVP
jgi:hypothetical protein